MSALEDVAERIFKSVEEYVERGLSTLSGRIDAVEKASKVAGPAGKDGLPGERGEVGPQGERGPVGEIGARGEKGEPGEPGAPGPTGPDGKDGTTGKDGANGADGQAGMPGAKGDNGDRGTDGLHGKDAYQLALDDGFAGTRLQWQESLRGKDGAAGRDGREGRDGKDGMAGKDAADIAVIPEIAADRSYPQGTFAACYGGMLFATRDTDPLPVGTKPKGLQAAGWRVVMNGIMVETEALSEDGRTITRTTTYTDGRELVREVKTAAMIDRGVWREGEYQAGDTVTFGGSAFVCQRTTTDKPETSDAWRLAVKRGRDGKDKS